MKLAAAANTEVPAYLVICGMGYTINVKELSNNNQIWCAVKNENEFVGDGPLELLALIKLYECRGEKWQATDSEIDAFIKQYGQNS